MKLTTPDAEKLLTIIAGSELNDSLAAQAAYSGPKAMRKLGLAQHLKAMAAGSSQRTAELRVLGKKLQWPKRSVESGRLPSVSFVAKSVGMKEEYDFLYHASSRYVHFSVAELLRRAWGKSGEVTLESSHFNTYWGAFAAFWGINLFIEALAEIGEWLPDSEQIPEIEEAEILRAADELGKIGQVPIITAAELYWDTDEFLSG